MEIVVLLGIAGLVFLLWPSSPPPAPTLSASLAPAASSPQAAGTSQTYQASMIALSHVRARLLVTDQLDESAKGAIETITHHLVESSDK